MPRWSYVQEIARQRIGSLSSSDLSTEDLAPRLMAALQDAIGWDGYRLLGVDQQSLLVNRVISASEEDAWARLEWLSDVYLAAEPLGYIELPFLMRSGLSAVAFQDRQDQCWGYPPSFLSDVSPRDHTRLFHEQGTPVGGSILASFSAEGRWVASLQAYRRDDRSPFRATDVAFVQAMARQIGTGLDAALARDRLRNVGEAALPDASGVLLVDRDGTIRFATPAGESWVDVLRVTDHERQTGLPSACWAAIADLRQRPATAMSSAVSVTTPNGNVRVEASPATADGSVALILTAERPHIDPASIPYGWPLTPRERAVAAHVVQGLTNRQVSQALFIGEHTVESHLRQIYGKLEVRSRSQLVARWFRESKLPTFARDAHVLQPEP